VTYWQVNKVSVSTTEWKLLYLQEFSNYIGSLLLDFLYENIDSSIYYID